MRLTIRKITIAPAVPSNKRSDVEKSIPLIVITKFLTIITGFVKKSNNQIFSSSHQVKRESTL